MDEHYDKDKNQDEDKHQDKDKRLWDSKWRS